MDNQVWRMGLLNWIVVKNLTKLQPFYFREHKIDADLGPLMIAYRETAVKAARDTITFERNMLDKKYSIVIDLEIAEPTHASDQVGHTVRAHIHV